MDFNAALEDLLINQQYHVALAMVQFESPVAFAAAVQETFNRGERSPDSHIEALFLIWWEAVARATWSDAFTTLQLHGQHDVLTAAGRYRLDFRVGSSNAALLAIANRFGQSEPLIGIELDGRDFHERTREQVVVRDRRDRDLQAVGWKVFHFSGSELVANPAACVSEVLDFARDAHRQFTDSVLHSFVGEHR